MELPEWITGIGGLGAGVLGLLYWFGTRVGNFLHPIITDLYEMLKNFITSTQELQMAIKTTIDEHDTRKFKKLDEIHADVAETKNRVTDIHKTVVK